ncbi:MAG: toprim domain-containing protein [Acidobacteria bacterium]|nr:toprim domain-containing protein [Acidobacteriota bacterium]
MTSTLTTPDPSADLADIKRKLAELAQDLAVDLFGQPSKQTSSELRWGRKGSLVVKRSGPRRGSFRSWEEDRGGSMLDAIAFALEMPFAEAVQWARRWLGEDNRPRPVRRARPIIEDINAEEVRRLELVRRIFAEAKPVSGTAGEVNLRSRAIDPSTWPDSIRWHCNCLIFATTSPKGEMTALQRVYVNSDGTNKVDEEGRKIKLSLGPRRGGAVHFVGLANGPVCLAEGPETALSAWYATGFETWAALGAMGSVDLSPIDVERKIIVCKDDDKRNAPSRKALRDAIRKWRAEGRTVLEILPFERSRRNKGDMNDALVENGPQYVRELIERALAPSTEGGDHGLHLIEARRSLARATVDAVEELWRRREGSRNRHRPGSCRYGSRPSGSARGRSGRPGRTLGASSTGPVRR